MSMPRRSRRGRNHPDRSAQFDYIAQQRAAFTAAGWPIISVDTKKKELIGAFKNNGTGLEPGGGGGQRA